MNIWVAMARGRARGDGRWTAAFDCLSGSVECGRVVIPLTGANYLELWHRRDMLSREALGATMRDLSLYATFASPQDVHRAEVRGWISSMLRRDDYRMPGSLQLLGAGANHAFGRPDGRIRFVESLASRDGTIAEGSPVQPPQSWQDLDRSGPNWEWFQLVGIQELLDMDGMDRTPEHRIGDAYVEKELELRSKLKDSAELRRRLEDFVVTEEVTDLLGEINEYCCEINFDPHALFLGDIPISPQDRVRMFVSGLPSSNVWTTLRVWKHRDFSHPWEQHDWTDLVALSVAIPYSDFVVTEKRWAHLATVSGLAARYGTNVASGLKAVEAICKKLR